MVLLSEKDASTLIQGITQIINDYVDHGPPSEKHPGSLEDYYYFLDKSYAELKEIIADNVHNFITI